MSTLLPRGASLALLVLGIAVYIAVAVIEWRLGSIYHAGLALALAVFFLFTGRGGRVTVGTALMLGAVLAYGIFRATAGLRLLGAV